MKELLKYPLNIQKFAVDGDAGADEGDKNSTTTTEPKDPVVLTQADIDRAVTKAVQTREAKLAKDHESQVAKAVADALAEEKRKADLTEEQRAEEARNKAELALSEKEAELNLKLLRVDVGQELVTKGLDQGLLEYVLGEDLEDSKAKITELVSIIDKQVEAGIQKVVVKPGVPKKQTGTPMTKDEINKIANRAERQKAIAENLHLYE